MIAGESLLEVLHISGASCQENNDPIGSVWNTDVSDFGEGLTGLKIETKTTGLIVKKYSWGLPEAFLYISESDFEALPEQFNFTATQKFTRNATSLTT